MGYLQNNLNMKVTFLVLALALAVSAKTRRGPLPQIIREKFHDDLKTNEPRIVGGGIISISERPFQVGLEYSFFDYSSSTVANDACVLTLAESVTDSNAGTVSLATSGSFSDGDMFEVSGWGTTSEGGDTSTSLRMVSVPYVDDATCDSAYGSYGGIVADVMLCAGEAGKDSCQGDSGGPMTFNGQHVGIVSWGVGCARSGYPGVYGQTDAMYDFITCA